MTVMDYANVRRRALHREEPDKKSRILTTARIAGLLYLVVAICGGFAEFVRTSLIESGDATATARNILDNEWLFRVSFASDLVAFSADVALALLLYALLRPVNATLALLAAFFRLAQGAVLGINLLNQFFALLVLSGESYLDVFEPSQLDALALLFLEAHGYGYLIGLVFFALSNLVLGYLVLKSRFLPWILGVGHLTLVASGTSPTATHPL
jgi:hypothetical protein